jgi:hypothetical protein
MKDNKDFAEMHFIVNGDDLGPQVSYKIIEIELQ